MARTPITPQKITSTGVDVTLEAANVDGNSIPLRIGLVLLVRNGDVAGKTVTVPTPLTVDGLAVEERTVAVPADEDRYIALGGQSAYRQEDGSAHVNYDDVTSVSVALLQI